MISSPSNLNSQALSEIQEKISAWIDNNGYSTRGNLVWKIGIAGADKILKIQGQILTDMECIHWKYWNCESFQEAFHIMKEFNKSTFIMKSDLSDYLGKGTYIFVYKTQITRSSMLGHLINFPAQMSISR